MSTPKHISALELFDIDSDPDKLLKRIEAKPMPAPEGEALLEILGTADIPDFILDMDPDDIPSTVLQIRTLHALALYGDANAMHLLFMSNVWSICKEFDLEGAKHRFEQERAWLKKITRRHRQTGAKNSSEKRIKKANKTHKQLYPLLAECNAELAPECKQRGWKTIRRLASRELKKREIKKSLTKKDYVHPLRKHLTEHHIQTWIRKGRPSKVS
jgi:uncharacterized membrane-anchored protein YhcB (DUF1043 family)